MHVRELELDFEAHRTGAAPPGIDSIAGHWTLVPDHTSRNAGTVLAQQMETTAERHHLALIRSLDLSDAHMRVAVREQAGEISSGGGLAFRWDEGAGYVVWVDGVSMRARVDDVSESHRRTLGLCDVRPPEHEWWVLDLVVIDRSITLRVDGELCVSIDDDAHQRRGGIGFVTFADARTHFDDFALESK
ncbi:MAG: hypothetical protein RMA76_25105 [Deltaproteobacteria bacterium]